MFSNKLKLSAVLIFAAAVLILTQTIFIAAAKSEDAPPPNLSALWSFGDAAAVFNFRQDEFNKLAPASCAEPPSNLISWYRGENNAADALNINNGTLQNGAAFAAGRVGQSLGFDGVDDFVQLPSNSSLNPASTTVEGWVNPQTSELINGGFIYASRDPFLRAASSLLQRHLPRRLRSAVRSRRRRRFFPASRPNYRDA